MTIDRLLQRPGTWTEDRSAILILLDQGHEENIKIGQENAVLTEKVAKAKTDLDAAHGQIRQLKASLEALSRDLMELKIRAMYISAASGFVIALIFELAKKFIHW